MVGGRYPGRWAVGTGRGMYRGGYQTDGCTWIVYLARPSLALVYLASLSLAKPGQAWPSLARTSLARTSHDQHSQSRTSQVSVRLGRPVSMSVSGQARPVSGSQWYPGRTQAGEHHRYSTLEHLKCNLSGSGYSISAVRYLCFLYALVSGKVAYESL